MPQKNQAGLNFALRPAFLVVFKAGDEVVRVSAGKGRRDYFFVAFLAGFLAVFGLAFGERTEVAFVLGAAAFFVVAPAFFLAAISIGSYQ